MLPNRPHTSPPGGVGGNRRPTPGDDCSSDQADDEKEGPGEEGHLEETRVLETTNRDDARARHQDKPERKHQE